LTSEEWLPTPGPECEWMPKFYGYTGPGSPTTYSMLWCPKCYFTEERINGLEIVSRCPDCDTIQVVRKLSKKDAQALSDVLKNGLYVPYEDLLPIFI
jgi:hypothetical protein